MTILTWGEEYATGIQVMDKQHTILFGIINNLHDAITHGDNDLATASMLYELADYTHQHFVAEEALMSLKHFPGWAKHCTLHREITEKVEGFIARLGKNDPEFAPQLLDFLRNWLAGHILTVDRLYGVYLCQSDGH